MARISETIVNSMWMTAIARLSMTLALPTLGFIFWLYAGWQDEKLSKFEDKIETSQKSAQTASDLSIKLSERLTTVETKQSEATISNEKFQSATLSRLDRMSDSLVGLSNAVAALTASVQLVVDEKRNRSPPER